MGLKLVFLVLVVTTTTLAWPWQSVDRCGKTCNNMPGYEVNKRYIYDYSVTVASKVTRTSQDSSVVLMCKANIEVVDNCEMVLKVSEVEIQEKNQTGSFTTSKNNRYLKTSLMSKDLRFNYDEGRISTLCPEDDEKAWVLNLKRGILSAFQGTSLQVMGSTPEMMSVETDVTGICPVQLERASLYTTIKSKNFTRCQKHTKIDSSIQATQFLPHAPSVLNSTQVCEQLWLYSRLQRTLCEERHHLVMPFSNGLSGAATTVEQFMQITDVETIASSSNAFPDFKKAFDSVWKDSLSLAGWSNGNTEPINIRTDLLFEHIVKEDSIAKLELLATFNDVCDKIATEIRPEAAELFAKVSYQMRKLQKEPLKQVIDMVINGQLCSGSISFKQFVIDALPVCESTACVGVMTDLIRSGDMESKLIDAWIMSFAFLRHPSADMINDITNLLKERDNDRGLYLSLSTMIHQYCAENDNCMDVQQVANAVDLFEQALGFDCNSSTDEKKFKVMLALKALGNSGQAVSITLDRCFEQKSNPISVRIAAMKAHHRISCETGNRDSLLNLYKDNREDSEIRVEAFRSAMKCLDSNMMDKVKRQMVIESSDQVRSYVWSYLKNLNNSSDALKQEHRAIVQESGVLNEFSMDNGTFSRNIERSFFNDNSNGATFESDVIFSEQSFVPRQVSVDFKIELFGFSIDLLEIGGRVEGIQYLLESMANGFFQDKDLDLRSQRRATISDENAKDVLQGSVYWKIFGNELGFVDLSKLRDFTPGSPSNTILQFVMELAKEKTHEYSKNMMLLEVSTEVSSCAGLPMKISVNGSASLQVKASGKMDIRQLMVKPHSLNISGKVEPSAAIEVSTIMEVDCFVARTAVQHVTSAHTSTSLEGSVVLTNGKVFNLNLNVPNRRLNIFYIKSSRYLIRMEEINFMEIQGRPYNTHMKCAGSKVEQYFGVALCFEDNFYFAHIFLEKLDESITKYTIEASYVKKQTAINEEVFITDVVHFMVGTPNTVIKRTYSIDMTLNRGENLTVNLVTPTKTASLFADFVKQPLMLKLEILFFIDVGPINALSFKLNVERDPENQRVKLIPLINYQESTDQTSVRCLVSGNVTKDTGQQSIEINLVFFKDDHHITLSGSVQKIVGVNKLTYVTDLNLRDRYNNVIRIDGEIVKRVDMLTSAITLKEVGANRYGEIINIAMKFTNNTSEKYKAYDFMTSMTFSHLRKFDFRIDSIAKFNPLHSESFHRLRYSHVGCQGNKVIALEHNFDLIKSEANLQNALELSLRLPAFEKEFRITQTLNRNAESPLNFVVDLDEIVSTAKLFHTKLNLNTDGTQELPRGSFIFELSTLLREGMFTQTWEKVHANRVIAITTLKTEADRTSTMAIVWEKSEREEDEYKKLSININITTPEETQVTVEYYIELSSEEMDTELTTLKDNERIVFLKLELDDLSDSTKWKKELTLTCMIPQLETLKDVTWILELEYRKDSVSAGHTDVLIDESLTCVSVLTYAPEKTITNRLTFNDRSTETEKIFAVQLTTTTPAQLLEVQFDHRYTETIFSPHLEVSLSGADVLTADLVYEIQENGAVKDIVCEFDLPEEENDIQLKSILSNSESVKSFEISVTQAGAETVQVEINMVPTISESEEQFDIAFNVANTYITGYDMNSDFMYAQENGGATVTVGTNITINGRQQIENQYLSIGN